VKGGKSGIPENQKGRLSPSLCFIFFLFLIEVEFCFSTGPEGPVSSADSYCCFSAFIIVIDRFFIVVCFCLFLFLFLYWWG